MKRRLFWTRVCFSIFSVLLFTACPGGGGGDGDDDDNTAPGSTPQTAPESLSQTMVTLSVAGETARQVTFTDGSNWQETRGGTTINGTYAYQRRADGVSAVVTLDEPSFSSEVTLLFTSDNSGSFNYTGGRAGQGFFSLSSLDPNPDPDPGPDPDPDPTPGPWDGTAPASLAGRVMLGTRTFTSTGPRGQTHTYTFSSRSFHDSDPPEETDGNYTYSANGNTAQLVLNYTRPASFNGDRHEMEMRFDSRNTGTFTSIYSRADNTTIIINGTFLIEE